MSVGLNCALGPAEMRSFIAELSAMAPIYVTAYPNAGLPDPMSETGFPETPQTMAPQLLEWAQNGVVQGVLIGIIAICVVGSIVSVLGWIRRSRAPAQVR